MAFDYPIVYEDRDEIRTSRWSFDGIATIDSGNTDGGWLWYSSVKTGDNLVVSVYKDAAGATKVATSDSVDVSTASTTPVKLTLSAHGDSGMSGTLWVHDWTSDVTLVPIRVSLVMDADIQLRYARSEDGHMSAVWNSTTGYAAYASMATGFILRLASNIYSDQIGGFGGREDLPLTDPSRLVPDYRVFVATEQMEDAAVLYACWQLFWAVDESDGEDSVPYQKGLACKEQYEAAVAAWNLTLNIDPDDDSDADLSKSASVVKTVRT